MALPSDRSTLSLSAPLLSFPAEPRIEQRISDLPGPESVSPSSRQAVNVSHLAQSQLFAGAPESVLGRALAGALIKRLDAGGILITPNDTRDSLYVLLQGKLRVHLTTIDNDAVAVVQAGESVGELSIVDHEPRSAFVVAAEPSRLVEIPREVFWDLARDCPIIVHNLLRLLARRIRGNNTAVSESRRLQQEYKRHASIDGLTSLYNRRWLDEILPRQVKRSSLQKTALCAVMVDVDHFKRFNDDHGHQAGDFVLFAVARVLARRFRPTDLVARYGGEEFSVILPETALTGALIAAERVRQQVAETELVMPDQTRLPNVTVSMGVAELNGQSTAELLSQADQALYAAKRAGRNRVLGYEPSA